MDTRNAHRTLGGVRGGGKMCFHTFLFFIHCRFGTFFFPLLYGQQLLLQLPRLFTKFFAAREENKLEFDMRTSVIFRIKLRVI